MNTKNLRTNDSEDDLIFKQQPDPITNHKLGSIVKPIIKCDIKPAHLSHNGLTFNFYKPEEASAEDLTSDPLETQQTEDIPQTNTISGVINYDPIVGNKILGNTMPLPKKNNLLESGRNKVEEDLACKRLLEQIKEGDGVTTKPMKDRSNKAFNYIMENKKKVRKDSAKRKRSAKGREGERKLGKVRVWWQG